MIHYELTAQERTQVDGRWHGQRAPLCSTGDGHYRGFNPTDWSHPKTAEGFIAEISCPKCCERKHLIAKRERDMVGWAA